MVHFIDDQREAYGVESICRVVQIAPSTYYEAKAQQRDLTLDERSDGTGFVYFGARPPWAYVRGSWARAAQVPMFEGIPEARRVYNLIGEAHGAATGTPAGRMGLTLARD